MFRKALKYPRNWRVAIKFQEEEVDDIFIITSLAIYFSVRNCLSKRQNNSATMHARFAKKKENWLLRQTHVTAVHHPQALVKICVLRHHAWFAKVSWGTVDRGLLPGLEGRGWHAVVVHAPRYWSRRSMRIGFGTWRGRLSEPPIPHITTGYSRWILARAITTNPRANRDRTGMTMSATKTTDWQSR